MRKTPINRLGQSLAESSVPTENQRRKGQTAKVITIYPESPEQRDEILQAMQVTIDPSNGAPYWSLSKFARDATMAAVKKALRRSKAPLQPEAA